ncbi:Tn3 family transposase [Nonomuraea sp. NPDC050556]|uniref:Tn3 family transposase n=1 Tax=Nonomuraea sp. NPDC050556 TaxID=3364369 RepID=UPI0037937168
MNKTAFLLDSAYGIGGTIRATATLSGALAARGHRVEVVADGSQVETWENNLLAESHIRYGGYGGLAHRHISNAIAAEGRPVDPDDLATISPYITHVIRRFGNWILNLTPPAADPTTHLDLESRVLFAP